MEFKVPTEEMQKRHLFVAVPMYGGMCNGVTARSLVELQAAADHFGISLRYYYLFNESLVTRARNYCVDEFLRSDCTHMIFIDSDIGFRAQDVLTLLAIQSRDPKEDKYDIVCGPYPKKCIAWEKILTAVNQGVADKDPEQLQKYVGDYVFNPVQGKGKGEIILNEPSEVMESGTGFMMVRRATFERYAKAYPEYVYTPDHIRTESFDGHRDIMAYFDCIIDNESSYMEKVLNEWLDGLKKAPTITQIKKFITKRDKKNYSNRYLSEDYMFCQQARKAGMHVWLCSWMELQHVGSYIFGGSVADLNSIGATPTADASMVGKRKVHGIK